MNSALRVGLTAAASLLLSFLTTSMADVPNTTPATQPREWPAVLTIDDFEHGVGNWRNEDTGKLEWVDDAPAGKKALRWTAGDDGIGRIIFKTLDRTQIDFSQYQLLRFYFKTTGKPIWNIDPIVQQYPHAYGFMAHYYAVDTLEGAGRWLLYVQDLSKWENAWPDSFDPARQDFRFEVQQLAGAGRTVLELDHIQLVKNTLDLQRSYRGVWSRQPDGSQTTLFSIHLKNKSSQPQTVRCAAIGGSLHKFVSRLPERPMILAAGAEGDVNVEVVCPATVAREVTPYYGETLQLQVSVEETPGLDLIAELPAGTRPEKPAHPVVLCGPARQAELRRQWADPELRKKMPNWCGVFVGVADKFLDYTPQYPLLAHPGESQCSADNTALRKIEVPNLPMARYQCPKCGKVYSGPFFDAAAEGWYGQHMKNAQVVRDLGMAYAITGDRKYAVKAAQILRGYPNVYLKLPIAASSAASPAYSATSGAVRIGASYMFERIWLTHLAIGLDFIRETQVLGDEELRDITERVLAPSANLMLDHKVGVMNLQGMIDSAGLYAGLAADDPQLVCRALYDSHGILNLMHWGYLPDGNWWENPSYQNVANGVIFPALTTCLNAGIVTFDQHLNNVFKAAYKMYGPDGRSPILGTGGPGSLGYSDNVIHSLASMLDDPQLAWVAHHRPLYLAWSGGTSMYDSTLWGVFNDSIPKIPKDKTVPILADQSVNFPDYGAQVLRVPGTDAYAYIHYGRTLVHGHYDKLSINAYGKGGWYVGNVMGGYGHRFKEYLEPTSGSSTIIVDGKSQDADTGTLLFQKSTPLGELASAREEGAWKDVEHERTLVLTSTHLIVIDRCAGDKEHTYDWLWHGSATGLQLEAAQAEGEEIRSLGEAACYPFFLPATRLIVTGDATRIVYERPKTKTGAALNFGGLTRDQAQLFRTRNEGTHEGLMLRKRGKTVAFACVMEPLGNDEKPTATIEPLEALDAATGKPVGLDRAQAYRVSTSMGRLIVIVNYGKDMVKVGVTPVVQSSDRVTVANEF